MKKNIYEQTTQPKVVNAPSDELKLLQNDIFKTKGEIVNLSFDSAGNPIQVIIGNKTYTAGVKTQKGNYILYDGRILTNENGTLKYMAKDGKIMKVAGVPDSNLTLVYNEKLQKLGLLGKTNLYEILNQSIAKLQDLINKGAVGDLFRDFNDLLEYYYSSDINKRLKPKQIQEKDEQGKPKTDENGEPSMTTTSFAPSIDKQKLQSEYKPEDLSRYGLSGNVYIPKSAGADLVGQKMSGEKLNCTDVLGNFFTFALQSKATSDMLLTPAQINTYKKQIKKCEGLGFYEKGKFSGFTQENLKFDISKKLSPYGFLNKRLNYREVKNELQKLGGDWTLLENTRILKSLVRESLIEVSDNKKRMLTEERNIVKTRMNLLTENVNIKSKKSREKFCDDLLNEMIYLNRQGFDREVINEGFFDIIKGMFGNSGESILQMFKQKIAEWLMDKFAPEGFKKTWIGGIIVNVISNTPIGDIPKLTECSFLTKALSKGIVEELPKQLQHKSGTEGAFYDVLRNSLIETLDDSNLGQKIEGKLVEIVCPMLSGVKGKMDNLGSLMKEKALATA